MTDSRYPEYRERTFVRDIQDGRRDAFRIPRQDALRTRAILNIAYGRSFVIHRMAVVTLSGYPARKRSRPGPS